MKKILYLLSILAILVFTSCLEEKDNWYTETSTLDGRYVVATTCEEYSSDNTTIADGEEAMIYNSAANAKDEIWIQARVAGAAIKSKFKITGDASGFKGVEDNIANIKSSIFYIIADGNFVSPTSYTKPTAADQLVDGIQLYTRVTLVDGKVIPKGATTIGGNVSDSVYIKTIMHHDYVKFISYKTAEETWKVPGVAEYAWKVKSGSNTPADSDGMDETWTLSGYRYTGMPEDATH